MPKTLNQPRPRSSISDMLPASVVEQATKAVSATPAPVAQEDSTSKPSGEVVVPPRTAGRTGEHTDIQRMYRLTPSALKTLQRFRAVFGEHLGFDVSNSAAMRSILYAVERALPSIAQTTAEHIRPCSQPSTAIGNEVARDALERQLAEAIVQALLTGARPLKP